MMTKREFLDVRNEMLDRLKKDLIGPESIDEIIKGKPLQKYLTGILWPINSSLAAEENETNSSEGKHTNQENMESLSPLAKAMNPSAVGISFLIDKNNSSVNINVDCGMYEENGEDEHWKRVQHSLSDTTIDFSKKTGKKNSLMFPDNKSIRIEWLSRPYGDTYAVSLFLVNRYLQETDEHKIDNKCLFQPKIRLTGLNNLPFVVRQAFSNNDENYKDEDTKTNDLLYRDESVFAVGHSISVHWADISPDKKRAGALETHVIPAYEIPMVIPPDWDKGGTLDMVELSKMKNGEEIKEALTPLCDEYQVWINKRIEEISDIKVETHKETAEKHMNNCQASLNRMRRGLELINSKNNTVYFNSFCFANRAMALQRKQSVAARTGKKTEEIEAKWRPFQVAFILQNLEGLTDPESPDRKIADLLWFPTGGGKTEAYLGLAAFTLAFRRMRKTQGYRNDAGIAVIMRYTLRLLTIQQFQRAASMICACETIRLENPEMFGDRPFRIGLWVGESSVPNNFDDAEKTVASIKDAIIHKRPLDFDSSKGTPVQLVSCPWCGEPLIDEDDKEKSKVFLKTYKANKPSRRIIIHCSNKECQYHPSSSKEGIPVLMTDEEIYRLLPDMLIGTVDKFARMPWKPEVQNLFGKVKGEKNGWGFISNGETSDERKFVSHVTKSQGLTINDAANLYPPELIIQDELHLISGPLGTMVGLYETAIDYLASVDINGTMTGPKIVASTATIRNADKQIEGLFTRKASIFPSPGLSHKDSFFAKQRALDEYPGRLYVGIFPPGRSMKTSLLRVYANQLASTTAMQKKYSSESLDPYQTLVGYFNSLRELGGAVRLIEDDVPSRMKTLENQNETEESLYKYKIRDYERNVPELTSRINSSDIPKILKRLEEPFYKGEKNKPIDVLLASNMISVGVDVSRLGLMVVNGQPKTTAEYIQSTSRVGREFPGLVFTIYNWIRPRDISHYEEYFAYHSAIYRYVEPISVTPFASRARDRGLAGALVSMARLGFPEMTKANAPGNLSENEKIREDIQKVLIDRAKEMKASPQEVENHLNSLFQQWEEAIELSQLVYSRNRKKDISNLLYPLGMKENGVFKTPNSMRDVEATAGIYLRRD
ncbi:DNA helicase [Jeotgalibacillus sp. R-1-5s-1]|nr:DNA helicase [Jeotgalibacillus sp. R-1-5s-1]